MSYSLFFKNFVILDVMFIASGFLWRVIAGAIPMIVKISPWLITCTRFWLFSWDLIKEEVN